jgi:cytochrome c-type biogenesis protein CcsB
MTINVAAIESFCTNSCFVILFFTTCYYWFVISFSSKSNYTSTGLLGYGSAILVLTIHLLLRWVDSGHFPLSNLYESLIFLAWCLLFLHIFIETSMKTLFLGALTTPAIESLVAFTDFSLPPELQRSGPLVPALQSNWLVMHVTVMIASYAALFLGCFFALAYLLFSNVVTQKSMSSSDVSTDWNNSYIKNQSTPKKDVFWEEIPFQKNTVTQVLLFQKNSSFGTKTLTVLQSLDNLSYRTIGVGFCFLTLGILSGAVWANETWGTYWSWDPKETWAFITWLTFAGYLHSRLIGGWAGTKPAWIAAFGFVIVWVCYLGVNLLGQGLHSYGFLNI